MYTVFLTGGIASGKSTVARLLAEHGAVLVSLDELSREVLAPGAPALAAVAAAFGDEVLDADGALNRAVLARRALSTPEGAARLEALELPYVANALAQALDAATAAMSAVCVVEVPLLDRAFAYGMTQAADEVLAVIAPRELRRERAQARGMQPQDFDARDALQVSEGYLREHADALIENLGDEAALVRAVDTWWHARTIAGAWREATVAPLSATTSVVASGAASAAVSAAREAVA